MEKVIEPWVELANGVRVPSPGYGTWQVPGGEEGEAAIRGAVAAGYRHFDTAPVYGNEFSIGPALKGSGVGRGELFIAGKVWNSNRGYELAIRACKMSLKRLRQEYFDLYLIHSPAPKGVYETWREINRETWGALETLYEEGVVRAIGVCNGTPEYLLPLVEDARIPPQVNQIECHPGFFPEETVRLCREHQIAVEGWSPLGSGSLLDEPALRSLAVRYGKTAAQICLRWAVQRGIIPLPRTVSPVRMRENRAIFDFEISPEDMAVIDGFPCMGYSGLTPDNFDEMQGQGGGG